MRWRGFCIHFRTLTPPHCIPSSSLHRRMNASVSVETSISNFFVMQSSLPFLSRPRAISMSWLSLVLVDGGGVAGVLSGEGE